MASVVSRCEEPGGFKHGNLEETAPLTDASSPGQEGGRRKRGELHLHVPALNSQEGLEDTSLGFRKRSRQDTDLGTPILGGQSQQQGG